MSIRTGLGAIIVRKVKRSRKDQERVERCVEQNICVVCEKSPPRRRGVCSRCEGRWTQSKKGLDDQQQRDLDESLIKDGYLLEADEVREYRKPNIFQIRAKAIASGQVATA